MLKARGVAWFGQALLLKRKVVLLQCGDGTLRRHAKEPFNPHLQGKKAVCSAGEPHHKMPEPLLPRLSRETCSAAAQETSDRLWLLPA